MQTKIKHDWLLDTQAAKAVQLELAKKVRLHDDFGEVRVVAGVDIGNDKQSKRLSAAVCVFDADTLNLVESQTAIITETFPYIPGYLSFREIPALVEAFAKLSIKPDLVVCDGQGYAHPRRFGIASHLGVLFDIPTIGCGKSRLIGKADEPQKTKGSYSPLIDKNELIGYLLRTRTKVKPVYVSPGHRISFETARDWVLKLCPKYRLPVTTRIADKTVRDIFR